MKISNFRELAAYQKSFTLQQDIFQLSKSFPKEETYSLTDQIRRSSRSIGANLAEAWRKRRYEAHFISKLTDADGENAETQHWLETALACGYIAPETHRNLLLCSEEVGKLIGSMIQNASRWCAEVNS